jgi:glycosyltransferase involved in cell wall biosynthesis
LKILQSLPYYPPKIGGVENQVFSLVKNLKDLGHVPIVVTSGNLKMTSEYSEVIRVPSIELKGNWGTIPISLTLLETLKGITADVIHVHTPARFFAESTSFFFKYVRKGLPVVLTYHLYNEGLPSTASLITYLHDKTVMRLVFKKIDKIIVPTNLYKELVERSYQVDNNKIAVIPYGIDTDFFDPLKYNSDEQRKAFGIFNENIILFVGRLETHKGVEYLLKAMPSIVREFKDTLLVIVGDGANRNSIETLANELGLSQHVRFIGFLFPWQIPAIMSIASVFVLPSISESFGIVLAESMSMEKPVIATNSIGPLEVVENGKTGIIVQKKSVSLLSEAVISILADRNRAIAMGCEGRKSVIKKFAWQTITRKIIDIYDEVIESSSISH